MTVSRFVFIFFLFFLIQTSVYSSAQKNPYGAGISTVNEQSVMSLPLLIRDPITGSEFNGYFVQNKNNHFNGFFRTPIDCFFPNEKDGFWILCLNMSLYLQNNKTGHTLYGTFKGFQVRKASDSFLPDQKNSDSETVLTDDETDDIIIPHWFFETEDYKKLVRKKAPYKDDNNQHPSNNSAQSEATSERLILAPIGVKTVFDYDPFSKEQLSMIAGTERNILTTVKKFQASPVVFDEHQEEFVLKVVEEKDLKKLKQQRREREATLKKEKLQREQEQRERAEKQKRQEEEKEQKRAQKEAIDKEIEDFESVVVTLHHLLEPETLIATYEERIRSLPADQISSSVKSLYFFSLFVKKPEEYAKHQKTIKNNKNLKLMFRMLEKYNKDQTVDFGLFDNEGLYALFSYYLMHTGKQVQVAQSCQNLLFGEVSKSVPLSVLRFYMQQLVLEKKEDTNEMTSLLLTNEQVSTIDSLRIVNGLYRTSRDIVHILRGENKGHPVFFSDQLNFNLSALRAWSDMAAYSSNVPFTALTSLIGLARLSDTEVAILKDDLSSRNFLPLFEKYLGNVLGYYVPEKIVAHDCCASCYLAQVPFFATYHFLRKVCERFSINQKILQSQKQDLFEEIQQVFLKAEVKIGSNVQGAHDYPTEFQRVEDYMRIMTLVGYVLQSSNMAGAVDQSQKLNKILIGRIHQCMLFLENSKTIDEVHRSKLVKEIIESIVPCLDANERPALLRLIIQSL